jgi:hypothetical protein
VTSASGYLQEMVRASSHRSSSTLDTRTFRPHFMYWIFLRKILLRHTASDSSVMAASRGDAVTFDIGFGRDQLMHCTSDYVIIFN